MNEEKKQQVIALGRLGWSLRRIQRNTGVRRETAAVYLKSAGIAIRRPGAWGRQLPAKPANEVITDPAPVESVNEVGPGPDLVKPANDVITDPASAKSLSEATPGPDLAKPANKVITDSVAELSATVAKQPNRSRDTAHRPAPAPHIVS